MMSILSKLLNQTKLKKEIRYINSHAVGKAVARPYSFEIDFVRNLFSGSAWWFFVIILKFILHPFLKSKFMRKNTLTPKKFHFESPIFINQNIFKLS